MTGKRLSVQHCNNTYNTDWYISPRTLPKIINQVSYCLIPIAFSASSTNTGRHTTVPLLTQLCVTNNPETPTIFEHNEYVVPKEKFKTKYDK